jgi:urea transport system ATP-binding protein
MSGAQDIAVAVEGLVVSFGHFKAIDDLRFAAAYGEVRAVIGPNGAGKTTLLDVLTGRSPARAGRVTLDGTLDLTRKSEVQLALSGIGRKFQKPSVFEALTVWENLDLACRRHRRSLVREVFSGADAGKTATIETVLESVGLGSQRDARAATLSHGQKQWLEIGMVLVQEPKVLLLDEPVAGMSDDETLQTAALVRSLRGPHRSIIVVEHDMDFVEQIADQVTVMHEGKTLFEGSMQSARTDHRVLDVYLGR